MADEAKAASLAHKRWILEFMKQQPDLKCSYNALVEEGVKLCGNHRVDLDAIAATSAQWRDGADRSTLT